MVLLDLQRGATLVQHCDAPIGLPQAQRQTDMSPLFQGKEPESS
jgi:hypothetical protein